MFSRQMNTICFSRKATCMPRRGSGRWISTGAFSWDAWPRSSGSSSFRGKNSPARFRGCDSVDADYFMRLIGIRRAALASAGCLAKRTGGGLKPIATALIDSSSNAVNVCRWSFGCCIILPDPWRPEDTLTIGKGFAFLLSSPLFTRLNAIAAAKLAGEPEKLHDLYPLSYDGNFTITRAMSGFDAAPLAFYRGHARRKRLLPAGHGSNAWVIGPSRSDAGRAILCNDPHLRMMVPSVWYLMHLKAYAEPPN